jgi:hypothetical protein
LARRAASDHAVLDFASAVTMPGVPSVQEFRQAVDDNKLVAIRFTTA